MKRISLLIIVMSIFFVGAHAQIKERYMKVNKTDGSTVAIKVKDVADITFEIFKTTSFNKARLQQLFHGDIERPGDLIDRFCAALLQSGLAVADIIERGIRNRARFCQPIDGHLLIL